MTWKCTSCGSNNVSPRSRTRDYRCLICGNIMLEPFVCTPEGKHPSGNFPRYIKRVKIADVLLVSGRQTSHSPERIERIRAAHTENPDATYKVLRMLCGETDYIITKYFQMIKTK